MEEKKVCALYGCDNIVTNWRLSCCCMSHARRNAAKIRHGSENKPNVKQKEKKQKVQKFDPEFRVVKKKNRKYVTPVWADRKKIQEIYDEAIRISKETGIPHEVDHIIPLRHDWVCGLHVETNLRIVTKEENRTKSNKFICD